MPWFCDTYGTLKAENADLKEQLNEVQQKADYAAILSESMNNRLKEELNVLSAKVEVYDQVMKAFRININLDGKKK